LEHKKYYLFYYSDRGCGIDENNFKSMFENFTKVCSKYKIEGNVVGLATFKKNNRTS